jgi:hypothetical protein
MELRVNGRWVADHEAGHAVARLVQDRQTGRPGPPIRRVVIIPESNPWTLRHVDRDGRVQED